MKTAVSVLLFFALLISLAVCGTAPIRETETATDAGNAGQAKSRGGTGW